MKQRWGLIVFAASTLIAFVQLANPKHWAHYQIFTGASRELWKGNSPYFTDFGTNFGEWFYSPSCGLTYYGMFAWLPDIVGIYLYMIASVLIFIFGVRYFIQSVDRFLKIDSLWLNWFWFWISFEMIAGILAQKLEITMVGIFFFVVGSLIRNKNLTWASFLFAMAINWKFQPIPMFGLITIVLLIFRSRMLFIPMTIAFIALWYFLPLLWLGSDSFEFINAQWKTSLELTLDKNWQEFIHVYKFIQNTLHIPLSTSQVMTISTTSGALLAAIVALYSWRNRNSNESLINALLLALSLGATYIVSFSPMGQTNAYVLVAPVLMAGVLFRMRAWQSGRLVWESHFYRGILFFGIVTALLNSDIITKQGRLLAVYYGLKPMGAIGLCIVMAIYLFSSKNKKAAA